MVIDPLLKLLELENKESVRLSFYPAAANPVYRSTAIKSSLMFLARLPAPATALLLGVLGAMELPYSASTVLKRLISLEGFFRVAAAARSARLLRTKERRRIYARFLKLAMRALTTIVPRLSLRYRSAYFVSLRSYSSFTSSSSSEN